MKKLIKRLETFDAHKKCLNVIVETPKGSRVKYAYDPESGLFQLKRALPEGMMFPFNFGFIPSTLGADGDPLDILILNEEPLNTGCLLKARLIGVIEARQTDRGNRTRNDRLIGLAISKESPTAMDSVDLDKKTRAEIEHFFVSYNKLDGKKFKVLGKGGSQQALQLVHKGMKAFQKESG
jgi:inorganic pyrophosphatase